MHINKQALKLIKEIPNYGKIPALRYKKVKGKSWRVLSDYVRMRDFILYGKCIASGKTIMDWRSVDAGHYESMGGNGVLCGFSDINVHAQAKDSNGWGGMAEGARYKEGLILRYGNEILDEIEILKRSTAKDDAFFHIDKIHDTLGKFQQLKKDYPHFNYPEYL